MEKLKAKQTGAMWKDETGIEIPSDRIRKSEQLREKKAHDLAKKALAINAQLLEFKEIIKKACADVDNAVRKDAKLQEKKVAANKGNFTWFNFDRSIKVEQRSHEQISFDDTYIQLCQEKLNEFLNRSLGTASGNAQLVSQLVKEAFTKTRGGLDAKKVMSLLKYETKIESVLYQEAMNFLKMSISRPDSKTYYAVSIRKEDGEYEVVNLNMSSI